MTEGTTPPADESPTVIPGAPPPPRADPNAGPPPAPAAQTKFCHACGETIDLRAEICPKCGVRQPYVPGMPGRGIQVNANAVTRTGKTKLVAALLAIFLGGLGVHKFYMGEIGMGLLYLVFCWTLIPAFIGFIEGILWLVQTDEQWLAKYGDR
jgi:TM2 domain-containing membrane protein YozV